ncbi:chorismate-binding protein, partial [Candidatus Micrarchaeota archaeon]|nr:chorismate-binding protein [Candidatus Micrarchaeota archaeon]
MNSIKQISLELSISPFDVLTRLANKFEYPFLLESSAGGSYSFVGADPSIIIKSKDGITEVAGKENFQSREDPLIITKKLLKKYKVKHSIPYFCGGAVGYLSYDYVHRIERLPDLAKDDLGLPTAFFLLVDKVFVFDHRVNSLNLYTTDNEKTDLFLSTIEKPIKTTSKSKNSMPVSNFTKQKFVRMVKKAKEHISKGDIYQVNLSQRLHVQTSANPLCIYQKLREINPSPFSSYI